MKETSKTREMIQYSDKCPVCKKEIKGFSESQVKYNLEVHVKQKHTQNKETEDKSKEYRK